MAQPSVISSEKDQWLRQDAGFGAGLIEGRSYISPSVEFKIVKFNF